MVFLKAIFQEEKSHFFINSFFKGKIYGLGKCFSMKIPWVFEREFSVGKCKVEFNQPSC